MNDKLIELDYEGEIWANRDRKEYHEMFKTLAVSIYENIESYADTCRILNKNFASDEFVTVSPQHIKRWKNEVKVVKPYIDEFIEEERKIVEKAYKQIQKKALENIEELLEEIVVNSVGASGETLSKTALNLATIIEKVKKFEYVDIKDPRNENVGGEVVSQISRDDKIYMIGNFRYFLSEDAVKYLEKTFDNKNDNEDSDDNIIDINAEIEDINKKDEND